MLIHQIEYMSRTYRTRRQLGEQVGVHAIRESAARYTYKEKDPKDRCESGFHICILLF